MTTISAGAAAGLLVALMVVATDGRAAEVMTPAKLDSAVTQPSSTRTVYQLRSPRTLGKVDAESAFAARI
ncbi:hypothetical protein [Devosia sp. SL43]|uniref:hypothetical protein n=1 Tax=Devosia sp. SL43 TaxID=2806348 RepID=UPI001F3A247E|nr:hypothetical protein [Devosia sp. SL43]UJW87381.1 hypothetical protein IM737_09170 [Devosia sp. SL43]